MVNQYVWAGIIVAVTLGSIVIIAEYYSVQTQTDGMDETKPWFGLSCGEMLDFSGSDNHHMMHDSMHMEFHNYYFDHCSEIKVGKH
jgi:hypothetical protein